MSTVRFFKPKKTIKREDGSDYLYRWNLFECKLFSIKIHKIIRSDYDCLHDHPWAFLSIILWGGYVEYREKSEFDPIAIEGLDETHPRWVVSKIYHPGSIIYRKAQEKHRIEIHQPSTSLVITFKKVRQWGFWTKRGWVPHFKYDAKAACE